MLTFAACCAAAAQNLPTFRGGLERTGVFTGAAPRQMPKVRWQFKTGGTVLGSPVASGGIVYAGSSDQHLYAIDRETGKEKWKFRTDSAVAGTAAVADGLVYFGSFDGRFYAVDAANGQLKWRFETAGERRFSHKYLHGLQPAGEVMADPWDFWLSSPAVWNGMVFFGSGDGNIYALDAVSGSLKWRFPTGDVVHSSPAIANGVLYAGSWDGLLYALEAGTGKLLWRMQAGTDPQTGNQQGFQASPAVVDGMVYTGCRDANVYAVDAKTGKQKWAYPNNGSWVITSPAVHQGVVYFGTSDSGLFHGLDAKSGGRLFTSDSKFPVFSSPAVANGAVYFGTFEGKLYAYDLKTHEALWVFQTDASRMSAPELTGKEGRLDFAKVISTPFYDDMVVGVRKLFSLGAILSSPSVDGGVIYFGSTDGNVYALE